MKILVLNIANNVTNFKTVASGETVYIKKMIEKIPGFEAVIASNKQGEFNVAFEDIEDVNDFDRIVVLPASLNFFGGKENPTIIKNYKLLSKWQGKPILILQTDARLPFRQLWQSIEKRGWGYEKEEVWINSPIEIIAQSKNLEEVKGQYEREELKIDNISHFPIERYLAISKMYNVYELQEKESDLVYYGSFRGGNRANKMSEYLCGDVAEELDVHTFGTLNEKQLRKCSDGKLPSTGKKIKMDEIIPEVSKSLSTIILGEKFYNNAMFTVRVWETLLSDAVVFIDNDFDSDHTLFKDDFRYVNSGKELIEKVKQLKEDENLVRKLIQEQFDMVYELIQPEKYLKDFENILR